MKSKNIRKSFVDYFKSNKHDFIRSSPVVPFDDKTLLFTNAGMNQFKPIFLSSDMSKIKRAVNSQKCIRVSGKHNDLEEVGIDTFHHTFFEMLGNWSFGDYYKEEAIEWAWDLLTNHWGLDKSRLWATVYEKDDDALKIWKKVTDIEPKRILRCGKKYNFWEMGDTGPCGPCSEVHYFIGEDIQKQDPKGVNTSNEYWELWNLVFIQNNRTESGELEDLPLKHVDTGAGLERIAAVLQGKSSNYDTDLFYPIIRSIQEIASSSYEENPVPHRVIADHIRMLSFSIGDGALPSNDGRGYVIRRILRRASRYGKSIGIDKPFLYKLAGTVSDIMSDVYPEVREKLSHIEKVICAEEESFNSTLGRGLIHFENVVKKTSGNIISGSEAFKLYDTYGFPLDLTELMAKEKKMKVNEVGFNNSMRKQKEKAKKSKKFKNSRGVISWEIATSGDDSKFVGYDSLTSMATLRKYHISDGNILLILDNTPFYAESGGQVGDTGTISGTKTKLEVLDVKKEGETFIHICNGRFEKSDTELKCQVNIHHRESVKKNHTATHLVHRALKNVLGEHVHQAGSLVHADYLRFDITHFEKISTDDVLKIERMVNEQILLNTKLHVSVQNFNDAKRAGAEALFGEKYGEKVRVIKVGQYSVELCGGTHVHRTGDIGSFKILEESSLSSGVRRIVAHTGMKAVEQMQNNASILNGLQKMLNTPPNGMIERIENLFRDKKDLEKELKINRSSNENINFIDKAFYINGYQCVVLELEAVNMEELKYIADSIYKRLKSGIAVLFAKGEKKPMATITVSKDLNSLGVSAGIISKDIGALMSGGGGGKPHLATAGGKKNSSIKSVVKKVPSILQNVLSSI